MTKPLFTHWFLNGDTRLVPAYLFKGKLHCFKCAQNIDNGLLAIGYTREDVKSNRDPSLIVTEADRCVICGADFNEKY